MQCSVIVVLFNFKSLPDCVHSHDGRVFICMPPKPKQKTGFILLSRKLLQHQIYSCEPYDKAHAWIDLIYLANYKESHFFCRGVKVNVGVGQLAIAQETLAAKWRWTRPRVKRFLNYLESEHMILQQKTSVMNLISILNYSRYQQRVTSDVTVGVTSDVTTGVTHPNKVKERKESAAPISSENGLAPIKFIKP